ncbi:acyltransferase, partial [Neobacillus drentensis]|uniref:acyltransferase family protein n=1 Tax=Neobacillus drentensis TaxID=220684 RepID=UPI0030017682
SVIIINLMLPKIGMVPNLQIWATWTKEISITGLINHVLFLGEYDTDSLLMVIWSLVHEFRISIIFPFVVLFLFRVGWKLSVVMASITSIGSFLLIKIFPTQFTLAISTNYFITLHYLSIFIIGALIAKYRIPLISKFQIKQIKYPLIVISFTFYNYTQFPYMIIGKLYKNIDYLLYQILLDWIVCIGGAGILLSVLGSKVLSNILLTKPVHFLGKMSYSIYLVHPVVLITLV